ncbi:hypothetical protein BG015_000263 [Linnemannia schmuckeri]|uniref:Uncharacterized protein n=1 Tax=Linnemannia schmuckeri TaxID=64567 RepID=A0A9P5RUU7_9FUNG|nr:hypothetical protein BG015_000263 [Linnemannia schmuckeri]
MESSTPLNTASLFSPETTMVTDHPTVTRHLSIKEDQQRQIDSSSHTQGAIPLLENHRHCTRLHTSAEHLTSISQDDPSCLDQLRKEDVATATAITGFEDTQISSVLNTTAAGQSQSILPSPLTSSSLSSSSAFATATLKPAEIPKIVAVQPHTKGEAKSSSITISATPDTTITIIPSICSGGSMKKPSVKLDTNKKLPTKSTKTSSKPTKQIKKPCSQISASTMVQTNIDKFIVSRKASIATARPTVVSETKKSTSVKTILKKATITGNSGSTNDQPPALTTTSTISPISTTSSTTTTTTITSTSAKSKSRVRAKSTSNSPSTKTTKAIKSTTSSFVDKKCSHALQKTTKTPSSPPRLKANVFFGLLPPPTVATVTRKPGDSPKCKAEPKNVGDFKNLPKAGSGVSSVSPATGATTVMPKSTKIKNPLPESNIATATASTVTAAPSSSPILMRITSTTTTVANLASIEKTTPTEASRQVIKPKSALPEMKDAIITVKDGSERTSAPTNTITSSAASDETSASIEISNQVIKIKSSAPEFRVRPTTAAPFTPVVPKALEAFSTATASSKATTMTLSKTSKIPLTSTNTTTVVSVSKTKAQAPPVSKLVIAPAAKSKKTGDNTSKGSSDTVSSTAMTTTKAGVVTVAKNKATSKDTTASKSSSKDLTAPKTSKSVSTTTTTTTTTSATTASFPKNSISVLKPSKDLTISTISTSSKSKDNNKDKNSPRTAISEVATSTRPIAQPRRSDTPQRQQQPSAPHQSFTTLSPSTFGTLPSPISPFWPNEDASMDSPSFFPPTTLSPSPPPRRDSFAFRTSPLGIVLSLSTNHHHLQNQNQNSNQNRHLLVTSTFSTSSSTQSLPPNPPLPQQHSQGAASPRPKRLLELMLQEDRENAIHLHINKNDSPFYLRHRRLFTDSSSPRPQKRQRLPDITTEYTAGRRHGMFGQTAFEQALDAMSFKYPTSAPTFAPALIRTPVPATASQRLRLFQKRRQKASFSTVAIEKRVGGKGAPQWIP